MFLSTNRGMFAPMGSQPCLKKGMQMVTMIQNKHGSTAQCKFCVKRPPCCAVLKNATTPPPPNPYISEMAFSHAFQKIYTYTPPPL